MLAAVRDHGTSVLQRFIGWRDTNPPSAAFEFGNPLSETLAHPPSFASCTRDVYTVGKQFDESVVLGVLRDVAKGTRRNPLFGGGWRYSTLCVFSSY